MAWVPTMHLRAARTVKDIKLFGFTVGRKVSCTLQQKWEWLDDGEIVWCPGVVEWRPVPLVDEQ